MGRRYAKRRASCFCARRPPIPPGSATVPLTFPDIMAEGDALFRSLHIASLLASRSASLRPRYAATAKALPYPHGHRREPCRRGSRRCASSTGNALPCGRHLRGHLQLSLARVSDPCANAQPLTGAQVRCTSGTPSPAPTLLSDMPCCGPAYAWRFRRLLRVAGRSAGGRRYLRPVPPRAWRRRTGFTWGIRHDRRHHHPQFQPLASLRA